MPWGDANNEDDTGRGKTRMTLDDGDVEGDEDDEDDARPRR
jgi:hypothetical protein